jgi:hypothetical protein
MHACQEAIALVSTRRGHGNCEKKSENQNADEHRAFVQTRIAVDVALLMEGCGRVDGSRRLAIACGQRHRQPKKESPELRISLQRRGCVGSPQFAIATNSARAISTAASIVAVFTERRRCGHVTTYRQSLRAMCITIRCS